MNKLFIMKNYLKMAGRILLIAGIIEIIVGIMHFVMPYFVMHSGGFLLLNHYESAFVTHGIIAVGIAVTPFGILTIIIALMKETLNILFSYYCIIKSVMWGGRVVSELILPVKIPLFYINNPTNLILPLCIFIFLMFLIPVLLVNLQNKKGTI